LGHQHALNSNSREKEKQLWSVEWDIDMSHTGQSSAQNTRLTASEPPQTSHHTAPPTAVRQSLQDENTTIITACAIVADAVPCQGSRRQAGLTAVVRCKP